MHNYIFELSSTAIPEDERYSIFDIPDWFKGSIADAAYDTAGEERELAIASLIKGLGPYCSFEDGRVQFSGDVKEQYFRGNFEIFLEAATMLAATDYRTFSGQERSCDFARAITNLNQAYEEKFDFYIYLSDEDELIPGDAWVRDLDLSDCYYIGGVIDYHW